MCGLLDKYLLAFSKLRVDKNRKSWTVLTNHCSPYKPFLLLSVMDLIAGGGISKNYIEPTIDLTETWLGYIDLLPPINRQASMAYPFFFLESDGFWHLRSRQGVELKPGATIRTVKRLRECFYGAQFDENLFPLLQMKTSREKLRSVLIETYFTPEIRPHLCEKAAVNYEAADYSANLLLPQIVTPPETAEVKPFPSEKVRDQGFRRAIVQLYDHRCALCGMKVITEENHTIVDAAHIIPWSKSHDDCPTNGMALCKTCHWSFDKGLMSVDNEYHVLVSHSIKRDPNLPGHMMTLSNRPMIRPPERRFWPAQDNLKWHRGQRFRQAGN